MALAGPERRHFVERFIPAAPGRSIFGRHVLRQAEPKALTSRPSALYNSTADVRRYVARSVRDQTAKARVGSGVGVETSSRTSFVERGDGVDLIDRALQTLLQILAQACGLRSERVRDQALLGVVACASTDGYIATAGITSAKEEHGEPGRL
jgi:hypothetical protein